MTANLKSDAFPSSFPSLISNNLKRPDCAALFEDQPEITLKKGEILFNESNTPGSVYLVTNGMIKLFSLHNDKEMLEDYFQKGDLINCEVVLGALPTGRSAAAMTQLTRVKKLPVNVFRRRLQAQPELYPDLLDNVSDALRRTRQRLRGMNLLSSQQRVMYFLALHVKKAGRRVGFEYVLKPPLTHLEIGHIAGVGRQTVTTVMNELRRNRIIHFTRQYLIVRDMDRLFELSGMKEI